MKVRRGSPDDLDTVLAMFDSRIEWLTSIGREGQWGSDPWSRSEKHVDFIRNFTQKAGFFIAEVEGAPVGALVIEEEPMSYVEPAPEPELYVQLVITDRSTHGSGIGSELLDFARSEARARGIKLMRVDCYAGGNGDLVAYYVAQGFTPTETFTVGDWPGQVLELRLQNG